MEQQTMERWVRVRDGERAGWLGIVRGPAPRSGAMVELHDGQQHKIQWANLDEVEACTSCRGSGSVMDVHVWSDGPSMVACTCQLCHGTGVVERIHLLRRRLLRAEEERNAAQAELDHLRTHIGLYFDALEGNKRTFPDEVPHPTKRGYIIPNEYGSGYTMATSPSPYAGTWEEYLRRAGRQAPRYEGKLEDRYAEERARSIARREALDAGRKLLGLDQVAVY